MKRNRKEEQQKEDVKVFKETMKNFGIEQQEVWKLLGLSVRVIPLLQAHVQFKKLDMLTSFFIYFCYLTLNHLRKWATLPVVVVTELVDLEKNGKK